MSKFQVGQKVFLFNSISMKVENDDVYAILFVPVAVEGKEQEAGKRIEDLLKDGQMEVKEQYQLTSHQGVLDAKCLFASEEECKKYFRGFFAE